MKIIICVSDTLIKTFGKVISLLMLPLIFQIIYGALMSYLYRAPPIWTFEVTLFLYGSMFMLGAAYCHLEKKHVAVDALLHIVGPKAVRRLNIFSELVVLAVVLVMFYISIPVAYRSFIRRERSTFQTPFNPQVWWFRWVIPISCALISWQAFINMLKLITGQELAPDEQKGEGERNVA